MKEEDSGGSKNRIMVEAFAQNTREEVRMLGDVAGCISSELGTHQTTYLCITKNRKESYGNP